MAKLKPNSAKQRLASHIINIGNGRLVNTKTGEIVSSPYQEENTKLLQVRPNITSKKPSSTFSVSPKDTSGKTKLSGRDYARMAASGDPHDPDIEARPTGNARRNYYENYVMKERIRKFNSEMRSKGRNDILPTSGKEYRKEISRLMLDFKSRYPDIPIEEAQLMHVNPKSGTGTNTWGNLKLGPKGLNLDQGTAHPTAFRMLPAEEARRFGAQGYGTASSWEGTPDISEKVPRTSINPETGFRKPVGPVGAGLRGLGALSLLMGPITAGTELVAAKTHNKPYSFDDFMKALLGMPTMAPPGSNVEGPMG